MRLALISLLMIPLTLGCGDSGFEKVLLGENGASGSASDAIGPLSGAEVFGARVSACDGERLEAPPGGFVCTNIPLPSDAAYGLLEAPDSPGVIVPLLEQDGKWVTIAPLVADRQGAWSGDVTYSIYDKAGTAMASVEGVIAASAEPVTDAASEARELAQRPRVRLGRAARHHRTRRGSPTGSADRPVSRVAAADLLPHADFGHPRRDGRHRRRGCGPCSSAAPNRAGSRRHGHRVGRHGCRPSAWHDGAVAIGGRQ